MHALGDSGCTEVELGLVVAPNFGSQDDLVSGQTFEAVAHHLKGTQADCHAFDHIAVASHLNTYLCVMHMQDTLLSCQLGLQA